MVKSAELGITIDPSGARAGAAVASRSIDEIRQAAKMAKQEISDLEGCFEQLQRKIFSARSSADKVDANSALVPALKKVVLLNSATLPSKSIDPAQKAKLVAAGPIIGGVLAINAVAGSVEEPLAILARNALQLDKVSKTLNISTTLLQKLGFVAEQSGVQTGTMVGALINLRLKMAEAQAGNKDYLEITKDVSIALVKFNDDAQNFTLEKGEDEVRSFSEVVRDLAEAVSNAATHNEKLLIISKAVGSGFVGILPMLEHGADGFEKLTEKAKGLSVVVNEETNNKLADTFRNILLTARVQNTELALYAEKILPQFVRFDEIITKTGVSASKAGRALGRFFGR